MERGVNRKFNILISAYACEPGEGSEPGVGWNWVNELAKHHILYVVTRANNRSKIDDAIDKDLNDNINWLYYDLPKSVSFWKKGHRGVRLYYYLWQIGAFFKYRNIINDQNIDLVHHLTFGMYWMPSLFHFSNKPFIWGPVGGSEDAPMSFVNEFNLKGRVYEFLRKMARRIFELDPLVRLTVQKSDLILCKAKETKSRIRKLGGENVFLFPESGISTNELKYFRSEDNRTYDSFTLISIGRLLSWKGFHLSIKAFAKLVNEFPKAEYLILGKGPQMENLKQLTERLGITDNITFMGHIPRRQVLDHLKRAHVFVHPSLHDSGGWVCLEAMAAEKPILCFDLGGPAQQVTSEVGFKIKCHNPDQAVNDLAQKMIYYANNRNFCSEMGTAARRRVEKFFTWEKKINEVNNLYKQINKDLEKRPKIEQTYY